MKTNDKKQRFIYLRTTGEKIPCSEEVYHAYYDEACRIRKKEQYHKRCICPKQYIWACDGDCAVCSYHTSGSSISFDTAHTPHGETLYDHQATAASDLEQLMEDRLLLEQLFDRLCELDPDADHMIRLWMDDSSLSVREMARQLGRKHRTFADQLNRIREELRKIMDSE